MPLSFFKDDVTVIRGTMTKKNGQEYIDWSNPTEHILHTVQVVPQSTKREFDDRTLNTEERWTLRTVYDADIEAGDRVVWEGKTFEVDGAPFRTKSPTGRVSSTRCTLVRWDG